VVSGDGKVAAICAIESEFMSLDRVIQAPGGKDKDWVGGFAHGGCDMGRAFGVVRGADALLLSRRTCVPHVGAFEPDPAQDPT
jgi:hypothetical protein